MFYYYGWDPGIIVLIPAMIFAIICQCNVKGTFSKYSKVSNGTGISGAEAARRVLDASGLTYVRINMVGGTLTDNYDPRTKVLNLSREVYSGSSCASVGVACHEAGHAIQDQKEYAPLRIRNAMVPVVNFASHISWFLIIIGIVLMAYNPSRSGSVSPVGSVIFDIGIIAFVLVILFHLITLPVEINASRRAVKHIKEMGLIAPQALHGTKAVLTAAAMTYIASLAVAIANLLRVLVIRGRRD